MHISVSNVTLSMPCYRTRARVITFLPVFPWRVTFVRNSYFPETRQYLNYYGSQCYYEEPQALPQYYYFPQSQPQGPQVKGTGASMRNINSRNEVPVASESAAESNEGAKTSGKRKSTKYETFPHAEERYLVNLWKENHDQLESKNARKVWNKIVDNLNTRFKSNRTVDKCMCKIKYLIDKYKEKKNWNRNQSGGNLSLGCCDFVTFSNVKESAVVSPNASIPRLVQVHAPSLRHLQKDLSYIAMLPIMRNHRTMSERNEGNARNAA